MTSDSDVKDFAALARSDRVPSLAAEVTVDADRVGAHRSQREVRQDQRDVARDRDHWVLAVGLALIGRPRMDVDVGDYAQSAPPAHVPKLPKVPAVEADNARVERMRVEVVVEDEIDDPRRGPVVATEQECAALAGRVAAALAKPADKPAPQEPRTGELMPRRPQATKNRKN